MNQNTKNNSNNNKHSQILSNLVVSSERLSLGLFSVIIFILLMSIFPLKIFTAWRAYKMDKTNKYIHLITLSLVSFGFIYWIFGGFLEFTYTNRK